MFHPEKPLFRDPAASFLKKCPLCGVLNTYSKGECACCGWQGLFQKDPDEVRQALYELYADRPIATAEEAAGNSFLLKWFRRISEA